MQSNKIDNYYTPKKSKAILPLTSEKDASSNENHPPPVDLNTHNDLDIRKEIENINDFFQDDDDVFQDIIY